MLSLFPNSNNPKNKQPIKETMPTNNRKDRIVLLFIAGLLKMCMNIFGEKNSADNAQLFCSENTVSAVTYSGNNVEILVEMIVKSAAENVDVGVL